MALLDGLTSNRAELRPDAQDPDLRPFTISLAPIHAVTWAQRVIDGWPRWHVSGAYEERGMVSATHTTRFWRVVDDVHLVFEPDPNGSLVVAHSQSRSGKGNLGQNVRNLKALVRGLRRADQERRSQVDAGAGAEAKG